MSISTIEIRQKFLDFFSIKKHKILPSSSLIPTNDKTLLFTNAGMNQFKDVFLGINNNFPYNNVATAQRCLRVGGKHNDLENIGYTERHHTFFEMLGNFSFGKYFKLESIQFAWELLTSSQWFNIPKDKLLITVYANDYETYHIWNKEIGIPKEKIISVGDNNNNKYNSDNFWKMGDFGPCGPCSEIFYDYGSTFSGTLSGKIRFCGDRYIEIWNLVFMQFDNKNNNIFSPLTRFSVDTGMGLERISAVLQNVHSNYDTDIFRKLIFYIVQLLNIKSKYNVKSVRVIADHIRACVFLINDGVLPSNEGKGYVLRRIIRRAVRYGMNINCKNIFFYKLVEPVIELMSYISNDLYLNCKIIKETIYAEEKRFLYTLKHGINVLYTELSKISGNILNGDIAFRLYDTYGFPLDLTIDICRENNIIVDQKGFQENMIKQRNLSRKYDNFSNGFFLPVLLNKKVFFCGYKKLVHKGKIICILQNNNIVKKILKGEKAIIVLDETPFYGESGGQIGDKGILKIKKTIFKVIDTQKHGEIIIHIGKMISGQLLLNQEIFAYVDKKRRNLISLNHSATHLLHSVLRNVLNDKIYQKGSFINEHRLRFDFSYSGIIDKKQLFIIEDEVNNQIRKNLLIKSDTISLEDARNKKAIMIFYEKYKQLVRVIYIGKFSVELCCGTHTSFTGNIGFFQIVSECVISSGIHRIEAVTGGKAIFLVQQKKNILDKINNLVKSNNNDTFEKILTLYNKISSLEKIIQYLEKQLILQKSIFLTRYVKFIKGIKILIGIIENINPKMLRMVVENIISILGSIILVIILEFDEKLNLIINVSNNLFNYITANEIFNHITKNFSCNGGGNKEFSYISNINKDNLSLVLICINSFLEEKIK